MQPTLPILERRAEIEEALRRHRVVVLCGETGSGKTTQLPQICLEMGLAGTRAIAHTQPRRLAARAVAARIAEERNVRLGGLVGFKVRFQEQTSRETRIKVMTDGMLLAELAGDSELKAYGVIILDEAHERSLNIDFLLGYLRELLARREDLKLIITSATIDPRRFSDYFGGPAKAPVIEVSGRMYPVEVRYHDASGDEEEFERLEIGAVIDAVHELTSPRLPEGDILVFLPGEREIRMSADALRRSNIDAEILPLFSRLSTQEQDRIFHPGPQRRVILSTNVAETSLTVPGIRYVVDTGLARINRYDSARKIQRLPIEPISRASAGQRAGRCGRVAAGVCIRLYSEASLKARPAFTDPEIRRSSLASVILQMKSLGLAPIERFPFLDPPDPAAVKDGYETLFELGAVSAPSADGRLTEVGSRLARLPLDPRVGRMLLAAAEEHSLREVLVLAAVLSIQDPRERPAGKQDDADRAQLVFRNETSDFLTLLNIWDQYQHAAKTLSGGAAQGWCREQFLSAARMREWGETHRQLRDLAEELELKVNTEPASDDAIHRALLTGLITNVACRDGEGGSFEYRGVRGNVVSIFPGSVLFKKAPKWIMAAEVVQTSRLFARTVAKIDPEWIEELAGHMFQHQLSDKHLDAETGEPSAWERVTMSGIVVVPRRRAPLGRLDPAGARGIFIREALAQARWRLDAPFMAHNRAVLENARRAEAILRRRDVLAPESDVAAWFEARVPATVHDPATFHSWRAGAERDDPRVLCLSEQDVLRPEARAALDPAAYPGAIPLGPPTPAPLHYALAPGKDQDGLTATVALIDLPQVSSSRAAWLVPGWLPALIHALLKGLPKANRAPLESRGDLAAVAAECAAVISWGQGELPAALSETVEVLHGLRIDPAQWPLKGLPDHLRLRFRVVEDSGDELAADRDLAGLQKRFEARARNAAAARARANLERDGITAWDFGSLPEHILVDRAGDSVPMYPALVEREGSVSLTLTQSRTEADLLTPRAVRRLLVIATRDEVQHYFASLPNWQEMCRHFAALGTPAQLTDELTCQVAERAFLAGQTAIRDAETFEHRKQDGWGRLATIAREVGETAGRILEPRARVAHRFSGGTPRIWAVSVADIREHAAYLMPRGFLALLPWERLKHYPRYAEAMRERLFNLREDGSGAETAALQQFGPLWKRFTGWVAAAMSAEKAAAEAAELKVAAPTPRGKTKAPLPQARRAAPKVNLDAGEWAMQPGNLPAAVEQYRWALEELRVAMFAPRLATGREPTREQVEQLWKKVPEPPRS